MTYGQEARREYGNFYPYWLRGWTDKENGVFNIQRHFSEYAETAYRAGYNARQRVNTDTMNMLREA